MSETENYYCLNCGNYVHEPLESQELCEECIYNQEYED